MTNWEMFNAAIAKSAAEGIGKLFRHGLAITVLILTILGQGWFLMSEMEKHEKDRAEWRAEKRELQSVIDSGRQALVVCQENYAQQSVQLARLEEKVNSFIRKR